MCESDLEAHNSETSRQVQPCPLKSVRLTEFGKSQSGHRGLLVCLRGGGSPTPAPRVPTPQGSALNGRRLEAGTLQGPGCRTRRTHPLAVPRRSQKARPGSPLHPAPELPRPCHGSNLPLSCVFRKAPENFESPKVSEGRKKGVMQEVEVTF